MKIERVAVFVTGGTFDKEYNELTGQLFFQQTHVKDMLMLGRCSLRLTIRTLMMIDSLEMKERDRALILKACMNAPQQRIVVTHGTDTMEQTAAVLGPVITNKTVILTGAMIPYKFGSSDGIFNLGTALAFAQTLPCGVYVAMNGRYFAWNDVRKNRKLGTFERK